MNSKIKIIEFIHDFFLIKAHQHYHTYKDIIDSFNTKPGLLKIAKKYDMKAIDVHKIMREYRLNELNFNVFELLRKRG